MSMMFMMTAITAESICGSMDKGFEEYDNACQKYNEAKQKSSASDVGESGSGRTFMSQYDIPTRDNGYTKSNLDLGKKFINSIYLWRWLDNCFGYILIGVYYG